MQRNRFIVSSHIKAQRKHDFQIALFTTSASLFRSVNRLLRQQQPAAAAAHTCRSSVLTRRRFLHSAPYIHHAGTNHNNRANLHSCVNLRAASSPPPSSSMSSENKAVHPPWHGPHGQSDLIVHNSLTSTKVPFLPAKDKFIGWYTCGPTVYDSAHLGHARCYVTFDVIRRILTDYFKYNVFYVMNITDLDDKIILRSRRNHLLKVYTAEAKDLAQVRKDIKEAFEKSIAGAEEKVKKAEAVYQESVAKKEKYADENKVAWEEEQAKASLVVNEQKSYLEEEKAVVDGNIPPVDGIKRLLASGKGPLAEWLDAAKGATVTDHSIFKAHASYYEKEFLEDMRALGVRDSDALTRVTEYVEHIVKYVQKIIDNGFGYEANGSVYFDTAAFSKAGYNYAKLSPWSVGNTQLTQSGEGSLSTDSLGRKSGMDFALWKTSKKGEPEWDSPWGKGRPGWHIECSAMGADLLGLTFDVHSGGNDLKFPHHDNEIAQSESYGCKQQWVNHFWHAGHLNIQGLKMSKSLKNFITIRDVLKHHSGRVVRFLFLLTPWDTTMNFSDDSLKAAQTKEKEFNEFFANTAAAVRAKQQLDQFPQLWSEGDRKLHEKLIATREGVDKALKDNFDYPKAMALLSDLISDTNKYRLVPDYKTMLLSQIARYVDSMVRVFGVVPDPEPGFASAGAADNKLSGVLDAVTAFRDVIRDAARAKKTPQEILALCDQFRDEAMISLGVRLEDATAPGAASSSSVWKLDDPERLKKERDDKRREELNNKVQKLQNKIEKATKDLGKLREASQSPKDFFAAQSATYKGFDETGKPNLDAEGKELSKSAVKNVAKIFETKDKAHKDYLSKLEKNPQLLESAEKEIEELKTELSKAEAAAKAQVDQQ